MTPEAHHLEVPSTGRLPVLSLEDTAASIRNVLEGQVIAIASLHAELGKGIDGRLADHTSYPEFVRCVSDMLAQIYQCSLDIKVQLGKHSRTQGTATSERKKSRAALRVVTESLILALQALHAMHLDLQNGIPRSRDNQDTVDQLDVYTEEIGLLLSKLKGLETQRMNDAMTESSDPLHRRFATMAIQYDRIKRLIGKYLRQP